MAGAAQAQSGVYRFYVPHAASVSKVEWRSLGAGWDVTVEFDSARCEIACSYRRVRDGFGPTSLAHYLLPPMTTIRLYREPGSIPETLLVDPAGLHYPRAGTRTRTLPDQPFVPSRGILAAADPVAEAGEQAHPQTVSPPAGSPRTVPTPAPLRI